MPCEGPTRLSTGPRTRAETAWSPTTRFRLPSSAQPDLFGNRLRCAQALALDRAPLAAVDHVPDPLHLPDVRDLAVAEVLEDGVEQDLAELVPTGMPPEARILEGDRPEGQDQPVEHGDGQEEEEDREGDATGGEGIDREGVAGELDDGAEDLEEK